MSKPWQEFTGEFIAECGLAIEILCSDQQIGGNSADNSTLQFLRWLGPSCSFNDSDTKLFQSVQWLDRVFCLPNDHAKGMFFFGAQGRGISATGAGVTALGALRSCLGEALERRVHCAEDVASLKTVKRQIIPLAQLPPCSWLSWLAHQQGCSESGYAKCEDWTLTKALYDQATLYLPTDFVFRVSSGERSVLASETTGCAVGSDRDTAICGALLELVERDSVAMWWYGGREASRLQLRGGEFFEFTRDTTLMRQNSARPFWLNVLENDFGIHVVVALSADAAGEKVVAGFGAHTNILDAVVSAVKELSQMELGMQLVMMKLEQGGERALNQIDLRQLERANRLTIKSYPELLPERIGLVSSTQEPPLNTMQFQADLVNRLTGSSFYPFIVDVNIGDFRVPYVRAVIPEFESIDFNRRGKRMAKQLRESSGDEVTSAAKPALT